MKDNVQAPKEHTREDLMNLKGLSAEVFRWHLGDATNGGVSSKYNSFFCIDPENVTKLSEEGLKRYDHILEPNILVIVKEKFSHGEMLRAIPLELYLSKKWVMFGGNFIYTSDSRFPSDPIKIFDRVES